jgi:hypothetical protein
MLECFEKIVGSKSCGDNGFDMYIENLNISVKKLAGIANGSQITGKEYLQSKVQNALDLVLAEVSENLDTVVNPTKLVQYTTIYNNYADKWRGVNIINKCNLSRLYIDFVMFKCNDTVPNKQLRIIDGTNTHLFTFNAVAGMVVTIPINQKFSNSKVRLEVNNVDVRTAVNKFYNKDCECDEAGQTFGISVVGHFKCEEELLQCQLNNVNNFKNAVLYRTGALILEDLAYSTHLSEIVITKATNVIEQADSYQARSEQFSKMAKKSFDKLIKQSCCYDCNETTVVNFIP